ncbi:hypothetical protein C8C83_5132 [Flavobacterium sp. 90]|uniref:DUF6934 family protein n=1 Tax=unclassified Flavobacterium TaxID=196869 RepID=UPI000F171269|nr:MULTISPECIES: hypothetical protein [unclassified Flavobacterium]RKR05782.1 hypothetical protein C8C82_5479 [Flavobacterium sp. 81]TCK57092.1 hypothetical protein C8C83_5132 [Flavobacterium sp. 90]
MNNIDIYETNLSIQNSILQYLFESTGEKKIIKAVQYSAFETQSGATIYNLGFGNYNSETKSISDKENSNNGDMWNVFNTVLSTVPKFFNDNPGFPIYVQGSDSSDSFAEECKKSCSKKCLGTCKNKSRRIRTYTYFVDKYFKELSKNYIFFGLNEEQRDFVQYFPKNKYIGILVYKKK